MNGFRALALIAALFSGLLQAAGLKVAVTDQLAREDGTFQRIMHRHFPVFLD